jgi:hypothetical protein
LQLLAIEVSFCDMGGLPPAAPPRRKTGKILVGHVEAR